MTVFFTSPQKLSAWLMIALILAATWVRLWRFPDIPPAFNYDEAYNVVDSLWLWETGSQLAFLPGNTGRHALFHYLAIPFLAILGVNTFALRFLSVITGIVAIPLMYRWVVAMFTERPGRYYLGLIAGAGLAFSFWHITISRSGFRASLLLFLYILMAYLFWQGWRRQSIWYIAGAGAALGLCQYTYWSAALLPVQFGLFALVWTFWKLRGRKVRRPGDREIGRLKDNNLQSFYPAYTVKKVWLWVGIMAVASFIVFIPLGSLYVSVPLTLQYISQSSIIDRIANNPQATWPNHLLTSVRIFADGPVGLWQGRLNGVLSFDWLVLIGFWIGLIAAIKRRHRPAYLFLLTGLLVLWLPAPLNDIDFSDLRLPAMLPVHHAISNLRVAGVLPVYYVTVAIGLLAAARWLGQRISRTSRPAATGLAAFILIVVISGGLNTYNFFVRWPRQPFLYERYNGPILDLAQDLLRQSQTKDILIPFHLYVHPTMRLFFDDIFSESDAPPPAVSHRSAVLVTTPDSPVTSYMWLARPDETEPGIAYLTAPQDVAELLGLSNGESQTFDLAAPLMFTAQTAVISDLAALRPRLADWAVPNPVDYTWNDEVRLVGYQVTPGWTQPGRPLNLTLYWQNLTDQPLTHDIFIHAINSQGQGVAQVDGVMLGDGHRWRKGKLTPTHHTIQLSDQLDPGPYLIRLGLFNTRTGTRLPVIGAEGDILGDQVLLGLFYVTQENQVPPRPDTPVQAKLGEQIKILGYTLLAAQTLEAQETSLSPEIYWQATQPVDGNYTIFVQLLDNRNQLIAGYDTQPLNGNYPTSLWQTTEIIAQRVDLTLPGQLAPGEYRLVTGMYDLNTGQRLAATDSKGHPLNDNMVTLSNIQVLAGKIIFSTP